MKKIKNSSKIIRLVLIIVILLLLLISIPLLIGKSNIEFNQFYLESVKKEYKTMTLSEKLESFKSTYSLALNYLFSDIPNDVDYNEPDSMFAYLWANLPYYAIVYPSEMYYYYRFPVDDRVISGNLRLVEARNGKIGMGYFDIDEQDFFDHKMFGAEEGLKIEEKSEFLYDMTYQGKTVRFILNDIIFDEPKNLELLDGEEFITQVEDESGIKLFLYFNNETNSLNYILNEERPITDYLIDKGNNILIGNRTDYAFYYDKELNRKILFGVSALHVSLNDYFDGPFDQVYPYLSIRDEIYKVYPYTKYGKGIDEHGNFLETEGTRVAISPYNKYFEIEDLYFILDDCLNATSDKAELYSCLTYESKKDFHLESPLFYENGTLKQNLTI